MSTWTKGTDGKIHKLGRPGREVKSLGENIPETAFSGFARLGKK